MPTKGESKKKKFAEYLEAYQIRLIDERVYDDIALHLAPVSASYLRSLLRESGIAMTPLIEGVNQSTLHELDRTLCALAMEYAEGDAFRKKRCRDLVITAKDHAKWAVLRSAHSEHAVDKEESLLRLMTWLENPGVFPQWIELRGRQRPDAPRGNEPGSAS